ncbi:MAG: DUF4296 domain-containing protein [Flavobacteriales bacterium Tduv]
MKKIVLISFSLLFSCKSDIEKPHDLIPSDQMKNILIDLLITEETARVSSIKDITETNFQIMNTVLKKHKITEKRFRNTHNYYVAEKKNYFKILKEAEDSLIIFAIKKKSPSLKRK